MELKKKFSGELDFLSNMYLCTVYYEGYRYICAEQAYQASKCKEFEDAHFIRSAKNGYESKKFSHKIKVREDWEQIKVKVMFEILVAKFVQNEWLAEKLDKVSAENLVEENYWGDTFWGICKGKGYNILGHLLYTVRYYNRLMKI